MYQQCMIIGNLGRDPEMRYTPDGTPVTSFSVAVSRRAKGGEEKTTWFRVTCWNKLAETTNQYLKKGRQVMCVGEVDVSSYTTQSGEARASLELTARDVRFLGGPGGDSSAPTGFAQPGSVGNSYANQEEDIPF